jgi:glycosyltransferase involved in cell wall biosynthesis
MPKISVCVPTFNRAPLLRGCLDSLIAQTFRDIEILVSDNCSPDDTEAVVKSLTDPRIRYIRNSENIGFVRNINSIVSQATGDYVVVAHDDDVYLPEFLRREADLLDEHPSVGMVHCAAMLMAADGALTRVIRAYAVTGRRSGAGEFERFLEGHNVVCSTVMVRRSVYEQVGLFEPKYLCTDFQMWLRLALHADIGYVAEPLVHVRVHPDTVTNWLTPERWYDEFIAIVNEQMDAASATQPAIAAKRAVLRRRAALAQGKRFFVASVAETTKGRFSQARQYADVVRRFEPDGLPRGYSLVARLLINRAGQRLLHVVRSVWRARALARVEKLA